MKPIPQLQDKTWLEAAYVTQNIKEIAASIGCHWSAVFYAMQRHKIPTKRRTPVILEDCEWLKVAYTTKTAQEIADALGCSQNSVLRSLRRFGIQVNTFRFAELQDKAWLQQAYATRRCAQIAEELGCHESAVLTALRRHGISIRTITLDIPELADSDWLMMAYQSRSSEEIAQELGCSNGHVLNKLKEHEIEIRLRRFPDAYDRLGSEWQALEEEICQKYRNGESANDLAEIYHVSPPAIHGCLKRHGIKKRSLSESIRQYAVDESVFDHVTEESAYWAGFLMADGHINRNRQSVEMWLAAKDRRHIEKFRRFLKSSHPIYYRLRGTGYPGQDSYGLHISSPHLVQALARFGVTNDKSSHGQVKILEENRHFWRGLIDGDGSVGFIHSRGHAYPSIQLVGTEVLMLQFADFFRLLLPECNVTVRPNHNSNKIRDVHTSGIYAEQLLKYLYIPCVVALERKLFRVRSMLASQLFLLYS